MKNGKGSRPRSFSNFGEFQNNHDNINWQPKKRQIRDLTKTQFEKLKKSGMLWEFFPDSSGYYEKDVINGL